MYSLLPKPPIVEAVLEIHTTSDKSISVDNLKNPPNELLKVFPNQRTRREIHGEYQFKTGDHEFQQQTRQEITGFLFENREKNQFVQFLKTGYIFNQLKPYESWDSFIENSRRNWEFYLKTAEPSNITKLRIRFLNHLLVPRTEDLKKYIATYPSLPNTIQDTINSYFYRIELLDEDGIKSRAIHAVKASKDETKVILVIDNNVELSLYTETYDQSIWESFKKLRDKKNLLFFEFLTEEAVSLCK